MVEYLPCLVAVAAGQHGSGLPGALLAIAVAGGGQDAQALVLPLPVLCKQQTEERRVRNLGKALLEGDEACLDLARGGIL